MTDPTAPAGTAPSDETLVSTLQAYVSAGPADQAYVTECAATAAALVVAHTGGAAIPGEVRRRAVIEVAADLFYRRQTRNGISSFADTDLNPYRITRDPLAAARDLLRPYLTAPIA